ncbi:hypothetical protein SUDANB120_05603 [Streptomyces sp. enrichment culture]|uniref:hypothetical protein n=1 Tax=Streptomyces TaxID=1883 RepID=UPI00167874D5|nr:MULTISPECIES: hypothetical protein [Streptomyces]MBD3575801.1 hypothetical protein [Streptomyces sp. KD18]GGS82718.1 hypothetical protein GCM10010286_04250 [Streptomyces toxytricini]
MSDAVTSSASTAPDAELLGAVCRELAEAADAVAEAARFATELALSPRFPAHRPGRPRTGGAGPRRPGGHRRRRRARRALLRTLTDPAGLGWAPRGRGVARAGWLAGVLTGRESLAVSLAVCGLKARIRAAGLDRAGLLADPDGAAILRAVDEDRQAAAVRGFRRVMREQGAERAFALLTPSFADLFAWNALTDANPFNDHAGWQVATGRAVTAEPLQGLGAAVRAFFDRDGGRGHGRRRGRARRRRTPAGAASARPRSDHRGCVHTLGLLGTGGLLLVQPWRAR